MTRSELHPIDPVEPKMETPHDMIYLAGEGAGS
jgi:hypothetical protein